MATQCHPPLHFKPQQSSCQYTSDSYFHTSIPTNTLINLPFLYGPTCQRRADSCGRVSRKGGIADTFRLELVSNEGEKIEINSAVRMSVIYT
jgi:hypothetical protein